MSSANTSSISSTSSDWWCGGSGQVKWLTDVWQWASQMTDWCGGRGQVKWLHQSVIWLAPCHHISQSFDLPTATTSSVSASARHRALPYHHISQSFDLPPATTSVSHLTCPLPPHHQSELVLEIELVLALDIEHYHITASVSHLTCPLPPHQSVIWLAHCHTSVSHLTCPLPPHHQSELVLEIELVLALDIEHYHITASVSHLTCPLPPHQSVIWLAHCHHIISQS